jgi:hypothetical protein
MRFTKLKYLGEIIKHGIYAKSILITNKFHYIKLYDLFEIFFLINSR